MRCKCGGKLRSYRNGCSRCICESCGTKWDLDFSQYPVVGMQEIPPVRPPVYPLED